MSLWTDSRLYERAGRFGARLGARGFFSWWGRSLAAWLPPRARVALGLDRGRLLLQVDRDAVQLRLQRGGEVRDLGHVPLPAEAAIAVDPFAPLLGARLSDLPRWLLLPAASALRRRLALPSAAADRLRDVVGFEIERQTPFTADAVVFDARVVGRRDAEGQIDAELVAVPRSALDPLLAALGAAATTLAGIDVATADGRPLEVNVLDPALRRRQADPWRAWNWAFAAIAVVALAAALWQVLDNRRIAAEMLETQIATRAEPARRAAAERERLVNRIEGQAFLDRTRAARPTAVEVMDELSRRLPDGTYLEKLAIEEERLTLLGLSNEAPALIGRLQGSPLWRSPALAGALQPDPASGRDRFTLTAELTPATATQETNRGVRPAARR